MSPGKSREIRRSVGDGMNLIKVVLAGVSCADVYWELISKTEMMVKLHYVPCTTVKISTDNADAQTLVFPFSRSPLISFAAALSEKKIISNNFPCYRAEIKSTNKLPPCLNPQRHSASYLSLTRWRVAVYDL